VPQHLDLSGAIADAVWLIYFALDNLAESIVAVSIGQRSASEAWL
jgi:hypothetical protein